MQIRKQHAVIVQTEVVFALVKKVVWAHPDLKVPQDHLAHAAFPVQKVYKAQKVKKVHKVHPDP